MPDFETVEEAVKALQAKEKEFVHLQAKNDDVIAERRAAQDSLRAFGNIDAKEAKRLKGLESDLGEKSKDVDERLTSLRSEFDAKLAAKDTEIVGLTEGLEGATITTEAHAALAQYGGNADLLMDRIKRGVKLVEVDGQRISGVVGDDGKLRVSPNPKTVGQPMTVTEFVEEMSKDERFAGAFVGTGSSGGGAAKEGRGSAGASTIGASEVIKPTRQQLADIESGKLTVDMNR